MKAAIDALLIDMQERLAEIREIIGKTPCDVGEEHLLEFGRAHEEVANLKTFADAISPTKRLLEQFRANEQPDTDVTW